jgi:hypothetical protein
MFKCHVNLFSYIIIMTIITYCHKVELFESGTEAKETKIGKLINYSNFNCQT